MREPAVFRYTGHVSQEATGTEPELGYSLEAENVQIIKKHCLTNRNFLWHPYKVIMNDMAMKETWENLRV